MEFLVDVDSEDAEYSGASKARERTGRWTRIEHETFLNGLRVHGKVWKKIADMIRTRSVVQIRTHAQKYFLKLHRSLRGGADEGRYVQRSGRVGANFVQMHVIDSAESLEKPLRKKQTARQASKAHKQPTTRSSRSASFAAIESEQNVSEDGSSGGSTVDTEPYTTMAYAPIDELSSTSTLPFGPVQVYEVAEDGADDEYGDNEDTRSPTSISQFMGLDVSYDSENSLDGVLHCGEVAVEISGVEDVMGFGMYDTEGGHSSKRRKTTHPPASDFKPVSMHDSTLGESTLDKPNEFDFEDQVHVVGLPIDATFIDSDMFLF